MTGIERQQRYRDNVRQNPDLHEIALEKQRISQRRRYKENPEISRKSVAYKREWKIMRRAARRSILRQARFMCGYCGLSIRQDVRFNSPGNHERFCPDCGHALRVMN